jgi:hypothetical protein
LQAQIRSRSARLMLFQDPDNLVLRKSRFLHCLSPVDRPYFNARAFQGARSHHSPICDFSFCEQNAATYTPDYAPVQQLIHTDNPLEG